MLFLKTIEAQTLSLLKRIQALPELADTRLVGGTALALQLGHRISVDLDVFGKWDYSKDLSLLLSSIGRVEKVSGTPDGRMSFFFIDGVKVDCVSYEMYDWLEPPIVEEGVRLAGIKDIAAMKLNAITNRGPARTLLLSPDCWKNIRLWRCLNGKNKSILMRIQRWRCEASHILSMQRQCRCRV